ncbi:MAG: aspartyl/glutamyl-tRNA(Asn/Gln) amidotransferase subunit [Pseudomonadota bacterium]|jgi:aspartyl-tRNA(Asn)/glutamyl-tRNA(Gln) amidotransferase subunit A
MSVSAYPSLTQLAQALHSRQISAVELAQHYLDRIATHNAKLNVYLSLDADRTLADARECDARLAAGEQNALLGIPIAHKDLFCIDGWRTTCGSKMLHNFVAPYTATVVHKLREAGMVTLGKVNMDEFAMGSSNENSYFGAVHNPWDPLRVPGGSSGGSAACVAADLAPCATGTDTGGSIRQPSAFTNLTGIKPTYGLCSRYGMVAFASSLDQAGPIARSSEDCALLLSAMTGFDERDSTSLARPVVDYRAHLQQSIKGLRIGLPKEFFNAAGTDTAVQAALQQAIAVWRSLGAEMVEVSLPKVDYSVPAYYVVAPAEASSNLSRFDGVRYGHRAALYKDLNDMYKKSRAEGFGAEVKRRILIGTYVLSHGYYDAYYVQAQKLRRLIADDFAQAYQHCDLVLSPTAPECAYPLGSKTDDPLKMYLGDIFTVAANLTGQPAMSLPCGFDAQGLPIGMQLIGNYFDEARMLNAAQQFQLATDYHLQRPKGF